MSAKTQSAQVSTPPIAQKLERESNELKEKRSSLTKSDVERDLAAADERRQLELNKKIETAKQLEGKKKEVDPVAAAKDAPPMGKELPYSPPARGVNSGSCSSQSNSSCSSKSSGVMAGNKECASGTCNKK